MDQTAEQFMGPLLNQFSLPGDQLDRPFVFTARSLEESAEDDPFANGRAIDAGHPGDLGLVVAGAVQPLDELHLGRGMRHRLPFG
jgi:hypothetical protein